MPLCHSHSQIKQITGNLHRIKSYNSVEKWVIKFNGFSQTADSEVHMIQSTRTFLTTGAAFTVSDCKFASFCMILTIVHVWQPTSVSLEIFDNQPRYLKRLTCTINSHVYIINKCSQTSKYIYELNDLMWRYRQTSNISHTKSQNINASHLVLPNRLKPSVKSRMKM